MENPSSRRDFVREAAVAASVAALADQIIAQTSGASSTGMPTRILGRTSQRVSIVALGGWHIGVLKDEDEAIRIMHAAIDEGINFLTTPGIIMTATLKRSWAKRWPWITAATKYS